MVWCSEKIYFGSIHPRAIGAYLHKKINKTEDFSSSVEKNFFTLIALLTTCGSIGIGCCVACIAWQIDVGSLGRSPTALHQPWCVWPAITSPSMNETVIQAPAPQSCVKEFKTQNIEIFFLIYVPFWIQPTLFPHELRANWAPDCLQTDGSWGL